MDDDFDVFDLFGDGDTSMEFDLDPDAPPPPPPPPQQPPAEKAAKKKKKKKKRDKKKDRGSGESDFSDFDATDLFAPLPPAANAQSTNAPSAEKADKAKALPSAAKAASAGSSPAPAKQASQAEQNAAHKAAASPSAAKQSIGPDGRPMATTLAAPTAAAAAGTPKKAKPAKNVSIASPETGTGNGGEEAPAPEPELESKIPPEVRRAFAAVDKDGNGSVDVAELRRCLERIGKELRLAVTEEAAARALEAFDEDNSQTLDLEEFCAFVAELRRASAAREWRVLAKTKPKPKPSWYQHPRIPLVVQRAFQAVDVECSGVLRARDLRRTFMLVDRQLGFTVTRRATDKVLSQYEGDGDHAVTAEEDAAALELQAKALSLRLKHQDPGVRLVVLDVLAACPPAALAPVAPQLSELLADGVWYVREAAVLCLAALDPHVLRSHAIELIDALEDESDAAARQWAAQGEPLMNAALEEISSLSRSVGEVAVLVSETRSMHAEMMSLRPTPSSESGCGGGQLPTPESWRLAPALVRHLRRQAAAKLPCPTRPEKAGLPRPHAQRAHKMLTSAPVLS
ncbi:hypothetical protein EMIHUDRAFT_97998 [Emiliania huxleyi CCMP1516]|uniref:EF-hand domain-containing protein n=2 Tax=Emiliania huxleyi TaxID=2903 RepID=A0A0D3KQS9_EMIH1|nr:hypothetical protein EMIHUDRAFT_97998 [Emiliania huxleyi CCMP1516]EOD38114.1 hypothetical protein EMIHUDRAFT_97998 [Emiliania huxleyi CCMP1516]|eukprot:XP_005790543.1 hypothetical protein EMIHUDRAFT_97998 [Emiliania huxleyi CCMP1516]